MMAIRFAVLALAVSLCDIGVVAQAPQFEVASIKLNTSDGPSNYWQISGRRFLGNKSQFLQLIRMAWGDFQLRIENAPDWVGADRYDVIANSPVDITPTSGVLGQMMRSLLVERLNLAAHLETREQQTYALVLARPDRRLGPRLLPPLPDCPAVVNGATLIDGPCGPGVSPGLMKWGNSGIAGLVLNLQRQTGRRVIDDTGLTGSYSIHLEFSPMPLQAAPPQVNQPDVSLPNGPTIFDALEEQLGLKLESRRGTVEVLVIDRIERPTPD